MSVFLQYVRPQEEEFSLGLDIDFDMTADSGDAAGSATIGAGTDTNMHMDDEEDEEDEEQKIPESFRTADAKDIRTLGLGTIDSIDEDNEDAADLQLAELKKYYDSESMHLIKELLGTSGWSLPLRIGVGHWFLSHGERMFGKNCPAKAIAKRIDMSHLTTLKVKKFVKDQTAPIHKAEKVNRAHC